MKKSFFLFNLKKIVIKSLWFNIGEKKGGLQMKVNFEKIYYYSVSLISMVVIIVLLILLAGYIVDFFMPSSYEFEPMDESMIREEIAIQKYGPSLSEKELKQKAAEVTDKEITEYKRRQLEFVKKDALKSLLRSLIALIFVLPIYFFHFSRARKISNQKEKPTSQ